MRAGGGRDAQRMIHGALMHPLFPSLASKLAWIFNSDRSNLPAA